MEKIPINVLLVMIVNLISIDNQVDVNFGTCFGIDVYETQTHKL